MSGGQHIRAVGPDAAQNAQSKTLGEGDLPSDGDGQELTDAIEMDGELDLSDYDIEEAYEPIDSRFAWVAPTIAIALIAGWTALYGWAMRDQFMAAASAEPAQWTRWIIDWSVPVLLVGVGWLLTLRHSRAEAKRFAETAAMLSQESSELETRLTVVNRELSLAREFLGAQSRELESLGRVASERISTHAGELQDLIKSNSAQVDSIGSASETALGNMTRLRDDLPVIANSARDVSNQVGNAGRTAQDQLDKLVTGFERLNQFGKASETQVTAFETRVSETMDGFESQMKRVEETIGSRLETVKLQAGEYRSEVEDAESRALAALNERMTMLQTEAKAISGKLREAEVGAISQLDASRKRFEADMTETVEMLDRLDKQAVTVSQERVKELHDQAERVDQALSARDRKFHEETGQRQEEFDTREAQASEVLAQRMADLDDAMAERREAQTRETEKLVAHSSAMGEQLDTLRTLIAAITAEGETARHGLETGIGALGEQLSEKREALGETEKQLDALTESGIRLLEIIQSGAKHSREDLPEAIEGASSALGSVEQRAAALSGMMFATSGKAGELGNYLVETQSKIEQADTSIDALQAKLSEQSEDTLAKLQGLRGGFAQLSEQSDTFAGSSQDALREALGSLENATKSAFAALEDGARERVGGLANTISKDAVAELERSLRNDTAETVGKLEQAAAHASGVGREATVQLRDQLAKVNELTINLEQRIERAKELSQEQIGNDFARRMALITDSLNSNAIDLASALSTDVTDTAWDAYLKGDRGIFTRRAVSLLDSGEAKEIAELYQTDEAFKANVSRYIHDFEAMLRSMLSTRDGNALGVTILGSDMGKLYVVLAQSIERFRQ
ncbi:ATPase [Erythrobacter sp. Alg231-14]|uniref:ATPase n=1 Tax=Erythrobacter sp. Alg231-14 TaxID=1922225 RepID=UPI000D551478